MVIPELISLAGSVVSGLCLVWVAKIEKDNNKTRKEQEEKEAEYRRIDAQREANRKRETRLSMKMMSATLNLSIVNGVALKNGKINGNLDKAMEQAQEVQQEYSDFIQDVAAEGI